MTAEIRAAVTTAIPCYAVVGKVNMGKSAVLATLLEEDDDRIIRISPEPGETTRCQMLSLVLDGSERLRFIDTPGFQRPIEALRAIRALQDDSERLPDRHTLQQFVRAHRQDFVDECLLLEPLLDGAGAIYVIDPNVPLYDSFRAEIEILRWTGRPRLALLNSKGEAAAEHANEWRAHLGTAFNLVRSFNAHKARFATRRRLLAALNQIEEAHQHQVEETLALLDAEWAQRREQAAEAMLHCLVQAFNYREQGHYRDTDGATDKARAAALERLGQQYFAHIAELERNCSQTLLQIYRHHALQAQSSAQLARALGPDLNLARRDTWRRLGLTRQQLTAVGATAGAGAGLGVDVAAFGHTLGLGALLGSIGGGALAFFKGNSLPTLALDIGSGRQLMLGPPQNPNFGWVLLDSLLLRYQAVLAHAHGRRDVTELAAPAAAGQPGPVAAMARAQQKQFVRFFRRCRKGDGSDEDGATLAAVVDTLTSIEAQLS